MKRQWALLILLGGAFAIVWAIKVLHRPVADALTRRAVDRELKASQDERMKRAADEVARGVADNVRSQIMKDLAAGLPATTQSAAATDEAMRANLIGRWTQPQHPGDYIRFAAAGSYEAVTTLAPTYKMDLQGFDAMVSVTFRGKFSGRWSLSERRLTTRVERATDLQTLVPVNVTSPAFVQKFGPEALEKVRSRMEARVVGPEQYKDRVTPTDVIEITPGVMKLKTSDGGVESWARSAE